MEQTARSSDREERLARARCSLEGLSVGDAFGDRFFLPVEESTARIQARLLPTPPWLYTDATLMALSIVSTLRHHGVIDQDFLAQSFAEQYDPSRGYGPSMHRLLTALRAGDPWREVASGQFAGQGSFGTKRGHAGAAYWSLLCRGHGDGG